MPHTGTYVSIKLCIGSGADISSQVDINSCTDAFTHINQGVWPQPISGGIFHLQSDLPSLIGASTSDWWLEQTFKVRWACIHVLMHVHILNKVGEQKWGNWDTNTLTYRGTQISIKLCIGSGADMGSQVDINSCTDACTHSNQGV